MEFHPLLFLGFPVDQQFKIALDRLSPEVKKLFINKENLEEVLFNHHPYIGKQAGQLCSAAEIELLAANIVSTLRKIIPNYPYEGVSLAIFHLDKNNLIT